MTNEEIVQVYKEELKRLYGEKYADATVLDIGKSGWFYLGLPHKVKRGQYRRNFLAKPVRKGELLRQIEEMRAI